MFTLWVILVTVLFNFMSHYGEGIWLALKRYKIQGSCSDLPLAGCWVEGLLSRGLHFTCGAEISVITECPRLSIGYLDLLCITVLRCKKITSYCSIVAYIVYPNLCYQPFLIIFYYPVLLFSEQWVIYLPDACCFLLSLSYLSFLFMLYCKWMCHIAASMLTW